MSTMRLPDGVDPKSLRHEFPIWFNSVRRYLGNVGHIREAIEAMNYIEKNGSIDGFYQVHKSHWDKVNNIVDAYASHGATQREKDRPRE